MKKPHSSRMDEVSAPDIGEPVFLEAPPPRRPRPARSQGSLLDLLRVLLRGHRMEQCH